MREPPDFRELVGEDLTPEELERLRRADALLRAVPAPPPHVPHSLTQSVARVAERSVPPWSRRRLALGIALAAALAAAAFGLGRWTDNGDFETRFTVPMQPTESARDAAAVIRVGARDEESGNWELELDVSGLPDLPEGEFYYLWLAKDGEWEASCGTFSVGADDTTVHMTVSYRLSDYDTWVVSRLQDDGESPWLLRAPIS